MKFGILVKLILSIQIVILVIFSVYLYLKISDRRNEYKQSKQLKFSLENNSKPEVYITGKNYLPPESFVNPSFLINHQVEIMRINNDLIKLKEGDTDIEKTVKISKFILDKTEGLSGYPPPKKYSSYYKLWLNIEEKKLPVACFELSAMYAMFANNAGLPTRLVFIKNKRSDGKTYDHAIAESYHRNEQKWYVVDLAYKQVYLEDEYNRFLNVYEFAKRINERDTRNLKTYNLKELYQFGSNKDEYFEASLFYQQQNYLGNPTMIYDIFGS